MLVSHVSNLFLMGMFVLMFSCKNSGKGKHHEDLSQCDASDPSCVLGGSTSSNNKSNNDVETNEDTKTDLPVIADLGPVVLGKDLTMVPLYFENSGVEVSTCIIAPPLPVGMSLEVVNGSCQILGTPTESVPATEYTITASTVDDKTATATVIIEVRIPQPPILGDAAPQSFMTTLEITGVSFVNTGDPVVSCSIDPPLPSGLNIGVHQDTCRITGVPSVVQGMTNHTITATAIDGAKDTATVSITVVAANPPVLAHGGSHTFVTTVEIDPIDFPNTGSAAISCFIQPNLPNGLDVTVESDTCRISGSPSISALSQTYTVVATAADTTTASATVIIAVTEASPPELVDADETLEGDVGSAIAAYLFTNNGANALSCTIDPELPSGLSIQVVSHSCEISGTPTVASSLKQYTVSATAADGSQDTATITLVTRAGEVDCSSLAGGAWISVPAYADNDIDVPSFCVMKYEAEIIDGVASSQIELHGLNWGTSPKLNEARAACDDLNDGDGFQYKLINNSQWQSIARQIETATDPLEPTRYLNWSNYSNTGSNFINKGRANDPNGLNPPTLFKDTDDNPCAETESSLWCVDHTRPSDFTHKRTHTLPNEQIIWDFSGNFLEWIDDESAFVYAPGNVWTNIGVNDGNECINCGALSGKPRSVFGPIGTYPDLTGDGGFGMYVPTSPSAGLAITRGGNNFQSTNSGIFHVFTNADPEMGLWMGFRCVAMPAP